MLASEEEISAESVVSRASIEIFVAVRGRLVGI